MYIPNGVFNILNIFYIRLFNSSFSFPVKQHHIYVWTFVHTMIIVAELKSLIRISGYGNDVYHVRWTQLDKIYDLNSYCRFS